MATNDALKATLQHFKQQHQQKLDQLKPQLDELKALETTMRQLRIQLGETVEVADASDIVTASTEVVPSGPYVPRPDEFFGMSQGDAAKAFLDRTNHAVSLDELVQGLKSGGCKVGGVDPKKTLYISLVRNVREFVPVGNGYIGLRRFYPVKTRLGRPSKAVQEKKKKRLAKNKAAARKVVMQPKTKVRPAGPAAPKGKHNSVEIKDAVRQIMSDRAARTPDELRQEVESYLAHPVKMIGVYGTLKNLDFAKIGEKYILRQRDPGAHDPGTPSQPAIVN